MTFRPVSHMSGNIMQRHNTEFRKWSCQNGSHLKFTCMQTHMHTHRLHMHMCTHTHSDEKVDRAKCGYCQRCGKQVVLQSFSWPFLFCSDHRLILILDTILLYEMVHALKNGVGYVIHILFSSVFLHNTVIY